MRIGLTRFRMHDPDFPLDLMPVAIVEITLIFLFLICAMPVRICKIKNDDQRILICLVRIAP